MTLQKVQTYSFFTESDPAAPKIHPFPQSNAEASQKSFLFSLLIFTILFFGVLFLQACFDFSVQNSTIFGRFDSFSAERRSVVEFQKHLWCLEFYNKWSLKRAHALPKLSERRSVVEFQKHFWCLEFYNYRSLTAICCRNLDNFRFLEFYNFLSLNSAGTVFKPQKLQSVVEFQRPKSFLEFYNFPPLIPVKTVFKHNKTKKIQSKSACVEFLWKNADCKINLGF